MSHNVNFTPGSGGVLCTYDLATGGAYPTTGEVPVGAIMVSANATTAPTPVTAANGLYVQPGTSTAWNVVPASPAAGSYLPVRITDGSAFIGSGTEYTEGDTAATPKGSAVFWVSGTTAHAVSTANPLPISDAGGSLTVDAPATTPVFVRLSTGSAAIDTIPVSLASVPSHAVTNAGTFAVQATGTVTANAGTGTFAVSAASLPLPSGAATAAKQPALGTAGSASADVLTVQGAASMTALKVDGSSVTQPVSGTVTVSQATGTNLHAVLDSGTLTTLTTCSTVTNLAQLGGAAIAMGTGVRSSGTQRVTIATDDVVPASQSGTWTVQPGNTANSTPWLVTDNPVTAGGLSMAKLISAASTNATSVKASAGQVYAVQAFNTNAAARYLKLYNKASAPTVGTDTPVKTLTIPGNAAGAGLVLSWDKGLAFGTGIAFAVTTGAADSDTGAVAASELVIDLDYK